MGYSSRKYLSRKNILKKSVGPTDFFFDLWYPLRHERGMEDANCKTMVCSGGRLDLYLLSSRIMDRTDREENIGALRSLFYPFA